MPGISTSRAEVVQLTPAGLWLAWRDTELFLDHDCFPWFRRASVDQVFLPWIRCSMSSNSGMGTSTGPTST